MPRELDKSSLDYAASQLQQEPETAEAEPVTQDVEPEMEEEVESEDSPVLETETEDTEEESEVDTEESEIETDEVEEEEQEEEQPEDYYAVKIDGEEFEVTLDELQSGYQRQKDYTKKTQSLAEDRKAVEAKTAQLDKLNEDFMRQATLANELLERDLKKFELVDWAGLKETDPVGYVQKQIEVQETRQQQTALKQKAQEVYEHNQQVKQQDRAQELELQRKEALKLFPSWSSTEKATANQNEIIEYARSIGYVDTELANIVQAKDLLILDKARKYDSLQKTKQGITKKKKPIIRKMVKSKGVAPKGTIRKKETERLRGNLHQSGSLNDAAALLNERRQAKAKARA